MLYNVDTNGVGRPLSSALPLPFFRNPSQCPDDMRLGSAMEDMQMLSRDSFTFGEALHIWHHFLDHRDDEMRMLKRAFQVPPPLLSPRLSPSSHHQFVVT
jgi:Mg2+ and Co2+ transporter CorA